MCKEKPEKASKTLHVKNDDFMYQPKFHQLTFENFHLPFGGKLDPENRWVKMADKIPWHVAEKLYAKNFPSKRGAPALTVRMALGALIIKEKLGLSDMETVAAPFDASMLTHFRKRLKHADLAKLQEELLQRHLEEERRKSKDDDDDDESGSSGNKGRRIVDATCAPADIAYPTDIGLLNDAREKTERIIDELCAMHPEGISKPRTYRKNARKAFLAVGMKKSLSKRALQRGIRKQLQYIGRNLKHIDEMSQQVSLSVLAARRYREMLVISELYRQQLEMSRNGRKSISDRLVSISQPHVRPIVRGKACSQDRIWHEAFHQCRQRHEHTGTDELEQLQRRHRPGPRY